MGDAVIASVSLSLSLSACVCMYVGNLLGGFIPFIRQCSSQVYVCVFVSLKKGSKHSLSDRRGRRAKEIYAYARSIYVPINIGMHYAMSFCKGSIKLMSPLPNNNTLWRPLKEFKKGQFDLRKRLKN